MQILELRSSTPVPLAGAADSIAYAHTAGPRFIVRCLVCLWCSWLLGCQVAGLLGCLAVRTLDCWAVLLLCCWVVRLLGRWVVGLLGCWAVVLLGWVVGSVGSLLAGLFEPKIIQK